MHKLFIAIAFVVTAVSPPADAALITNPDDSTTFIDTTTDFIWKKQVFTRNISVNSVKNGFGPGGSFEGFRYATLSEVVAMWISGGIPTQAEGIAFNLLTGFLAATGSGGEVNQRAQYDDEVDNDTSPYTFIGQTGSPEFTTVIRQNAGFAPDSGGQGDGSWLILVSSTVPEPSTGILYLGLAGFLNLWRSRRKLPTLL